MKKGAGVCASRFTAGLMQVAAPDTVGRYSEHARCPVAHERWTLSRAVLMNMPGVTVLWNPGAHR